jgi:hypothetical protein
MLHASHVGGSTIAVPESRKAAVSNVLEVAELGGLAFYYDNLKNGHDEVWIESEGMYACV